MNLSMEPINRYFSAELQRDFSRELPRLRSELAAKPFIVHDETYGVGGETFRAFRGYRKRPSVVFREWSGAQCDNLTAAFLADRLRSRDAFEEWHGSLAVGLAVHWQRRQRRALPVAHKYKLVDLFIKWISRHSFDSKTVSRGLERYAHCALDRQTLEKLNECLSKALPVKSPSMGHIHTEETYRFCQGLIAEFTASCDGTPLLFDYFAWERGG